MRSPSQCSPCEHSYFVTLTDGAGNWLECLYLRSLPLVPLSHVAHTTFSCNCIRYLSLFCSTVGPTFYRRHTTRVIVSIVCIKIAMFCREVLFHQLAIDIQTPENQKMSHNAHPPTLALFSDSVLHSEVLLAFIETFGSTVALLTVV